MGHLIFDSFPSKREAQGFAREIRKRFGRVTSICETEDAADEYLHSHEDVIPYHVFPIIVIAKRDLEWTCKKTDEERGKALDERYEKECEMEKLADEFGGHFAGT